MSKHIFFAQEDILEVDKLLQAEEEAKKSGEFDILYKNIEQDKDTKEDIEEENASETDTEDSTDDNSEDVGDDVGLSQESLRALQYDSIAIEDFETVKHYVSTAANVVGSAIKDAATYLGNLGITYGPTIARNVYKGVIYTMGKLTKLLLTSLVITTKYISRRVNSFNNIKKDIDALKKSLAIIEKPNEEFTSTYSNKKVINTLKISENVNLNATVSQLTVFLNDIISNIDTSVKNDVGSIKHIIAQSSITGGTKTPINLMKVKPITGSMVHGNIEGYSVTSNFTEGYVYKNVLPGDVLCMAHLPIEDLNNIDDVKEAYNNSSLFLGIKTNDFKEVDSIEYLTKDELSKFITTLNKLCDICIEHQNVYESINKLKFGLRYNFRTYFNSIIQSVTKVSLQNTLIEYVYLKTMFIDKVYIAGAMDLHDYTVKVLINSLSFAKQNIKQLA